MEESGSNIPIWGGLMIGVALGVVAQRTGFCVRSALVDAFEGEDRAKLRAYLLAVMVALIGTQALIGFGVVDLRSVVYTRSNVPLVGLVIGGLVFGAGMVWAGGCPNRIMVRAAEGQGGALVTWLVFVLTVIASAEGVLAPLRDAVASRVTPLPAGTLPALVGGLPPWIVTAAVSLALGASLVMAPRESEWWGWRWPVAGAVIGALVALSWYVSVAGTDPFEAVQPVSLAFVGPARDFLRYLTMNRLGFKLTFSSATVMGVFVGAFLSAVMSREFRWSVPTGPEMLRHIAGGMMMGWGGVLAIGCTIGQGMAGLSTLSVSSLVAVLSFVIGTWAARKLRKR